ncbi:hypothetical protein RRG08_040585, partial [Elysia crispata]
FLRVENIVHQYQRLLSAKRRPDLWVQMSAYISASPANWTCDVGRNRLQ